MNLHRILFNIRVSFNKVRRQTPKSLPVLWDWIVASGSTANIVLFCKHILNVWSLIFYIISYLNDKIWIRIRMLFNLFRAIYRITNTEHAFMVKAVNYNILNIIYYFIINFIVLHMRWELKNKLNSVKFQKRWRLIQL